MFAAVHYESPRNLTAAFSFEVDASTLREKRDVIGVLERLCAHKQTINNDTSFYTVEEYQYRYNKYHELNAIVLGLLALHPAVQSTYDKMKQTYNLFL